MRTMRLLYFSRCREPSGTATQLRLRTRFVGSRNNRVAQRTMSQCRSARGTYQDSIIVVIVLLGGLDRQVEGGPHRWRHRAAHAAHRSPDALAEDGVVQRVFSRA